MNELRSTLNVLATPEKWTLKFSGARIFLRLDSFSMGRHISLYLTISPGFRLNVYSPSIMQAMTDAVKFLPASFSLLRSGFMCSKCESRNLKVIEESFFSPFAIASPVKESECLYQPRPAPRDRLHPRVDGPTPNYVNGFPLSSRAPFGTGALVWRPAKLQPLLPVFSGVARPDILCRSRAGGGGKNHSQPFAPRPLPWYCYFFSLAGRSIGLRGLSCRSNFSRLPERYTGTDRACPGYSGSGCWPEPR